MPCQCHMWLVDCLLVFIGAIGLALVISACRDWWNADDYFDVWD